MPEEVPKPKGGRHRIDDRADLTGIIFVLKCGIPWGRFSSDDNLVPDKAQDKPLNTRANLSLLRAPRSSSNGLLCFARFGACPSLGTTSSVPIRALVRSASIHPTQDGYDPAERL